jgi:hypothetical protein
MRGGRRKYFRWGKYDGRRGEGVGLGNDEGRGRHFGLRKCDGRRREGVGLGNADGRGRPLGLREEGVRESGWGMTTGEGGIWG